MIADFLLALSFLTRIPVPGARRLEPAAMGRAIAFFPVVGALLALCQGACVGLIVLLVHDRWLAALLSVAVLVLLTGAMHLDGLADTVDGLGAGNRRDDALRIMRDPTLGAYGVIALVLALSIRTTAVVVLAATESCTEMLIAVLSLSRGCTAWLGWILPYARPGAGLGRMVTEGAKLPQLLLAAVFAIALTVGAAGWERGLVLTMVTVILTVSFGLLCRARWGGVTGDTLGANTELCELAGLLVACRVAIEFAS